MDIRIAEQIGSYFKMKDSQSFLEIFGGKLCSIVVRCLSCHPGGLGSNPPNSNIFFFIFKEKNIKIKLKMPLVLDSLRTKRLFLFRFGFYSKFRPKQNANFYLRYFFNPTVSQILFKKCLLISKV